MDEVADKIEALTDADFDRAEVRALNEAALLAVGWRQDGKDIIDPSGTVRVQAPPVLASLDAAMTLVPEGWSSVLAFGPKRNKASLFGEPGSVATAKAATPALALCAAALRAGGTDE